MLKYKKIIFTFCILAIASTCSFSQEKEINRYNIKGKKQGFWKCYLDINLQLTDSLNARFFGYEFYDEGKNLTKITLQEFRNIPKEQLEGNVSGKSIKILDGKFVCYDRKNRTKCTSIYKSGHPVSIKVVYIAKDSLAKECVIKYLDFSKTYNNETGSYYWQEGDCFNNTQNKYWFRKVNGKWRSVNETLTAEELNEQRQVNKRTNKIILSTVSIIVLVITQQLIRSR